MVQDNKNSEFKPRLRIDLVSHPTRAKGLADTNEWVLVRLRIK